MEHTQNQPIAADSSSYPVFSKTFFIMDMVFSCLRIPLVLLGILGMVSMQKDDPIYFSGYFEILTGMGIAVFGLWANIALLSKKASGITMAYYNIAFTIGSTLVGIWQIVIQSSAVAGDAVRVASFSIGAGFTFIIRIALLICYFIAVKKFKSWLAWK
ncbi:MAG: hypothetical protein JW728_02400 [Candidatus Aureabacteria bacterium]|nr:hypothetical protein [Candidatus Auribacterota bacterium]